MNTIWSTCLTNIINNDIYHVYIWLDCCICGSCNFLIRTYIFEMNINLNKSKLHFLAYSAVLSSYNAKLSLTGFITNENRGPGDEEEDDEDGVGDPRLPNLHRNKLGVRPKQNNGPDLDLHQLGVRPKQTMFQTFTSTS